MIELEVKVRAQDDKKLQRLIKIMTDALNVANRLGEIEVFLNASIDDDDTITVKRTEIIKKEGG